jgi:hypothetical protein
MTFIDIFMAIAGVAYLGASLSYIAYGQPWMGLTMLFYCASIGTIYMAGTN